MNAMITQEYLRSILRYDPDAGVWRWRESRGRVAAGMIAGCERDDPDGYVYIVIRIDGRLWYAHRLAFIYMSGFDPLRADHENGDTLDNRWANLRPATNAQNSMNSKRGSRNISGHKGVGWHARAGRWRARIKMNGAGIHIGLYDTAEEAAAAYRAKATELFGTFARFD